MSIRSFWLIFLKVIGMYFLFNSLTVIPSLVALPVMLSSESEEGNSLVHAVILLVSVAVYALFIFLFLFRAGYLLKLLRLEDDFDEDSIELDVQAVTILTLATILIGGVMLVNGLPNFLKELLEYINMTQFYGAKPDILWPLYYLAECAFGLLLIIKHKPIEDFIEQRANDHVPSDDHEDLLDSEDGQ